MAKQSETEWAAALGKLLALTIALNADMAGALAKDGLTEARTQLLWELGMRGPSPQKDLAAALGVTPRAITSLVDGLVETGFVTRQPHPSDRRASLVTFTAKGKRVVSKLQRQQKEFAAALFGDLSGPQFTKIDSSLDYLLTRLQELGLELPGSS